MVLPACPPSERVVDCDRRYMLRGQRGHQCTVKLLGETNILTQLMMTGFETMDFLFMEAEVGLGDVFENLRAY